ncbi:YfiR family protein [Desulfobacterales bacterium HSG17]|nr:YfiR family protein [Desulfobacterales bacterium HSG17]
MEKHGCRVNLYSRILCFIILILMFFFPVHKSVFADDTLKEYSVKAAFTLNFARYAKWPDGSFAEKSSPCLLQVVGDRSIEQVFQTVSGEKIGSRKLMVNLGDNSHDTGIFHMIFICRSVNPSDVSQILASVKGKPVLTIGEKKEFIKQGGMINFFTKNERLYFEVNMDILRQQNVKLSSRLLKLAILVGDK